MRAPGQCRLVMAALKAFQARPFLLLLLLLLR